MKLVERLLGITGKDNPYGNPYPAIIVNTEGQSIPIYTPVIVENDIGYKRGIFYFPTAYGHYNRSSITINNDKSILSTSVKGLIKDRRVKNIDEFEYKKLKKIKEFITHDGAITFIIDNLKEIERFITSLYKIREVFVYSSFCGGASPGGNKNPPMKGDLLSLAITMYDLKCAIPVFNKNKSDGMAISIALIWPKSSEEYVQLIYIHEIHFVVNSYPENILMVDGVKIRDNSFVEDIQISLFLSQIRNEVERRKIELSRTKK